MQIGAVSSVNFKSNYMGETEYPSEVYVSTPYDIQDDIDKYTKFTSATMINYNLLCERDFNEDELPEYFRQGELMSDESD